MKKAVFLTPVITVFDKDGKLDAEGNKKVWDHLINGGIDGIVVMGSTGEFFSMSMEQKKHLIDLATSHIKNKIRLFIGTSCMTVEETVELSNYAIDKGADAVMIIGPYYFSLSDESIISYYDEVAKKVKGNIYLYNFPDRTGYDVNADVTLTLLRKNKNIVGFKDTVTEMGHTRKLIRTVIDEFPNFEILSGFDENFAHVVLSNGNGCIGGLSNLYPEIFSKWVKAINDKNMQEVSRLQNIVDSLMEIYDIGKPFIPIIKKAMTIRGIDISCYSIKPFLEPNESQIKRIKAIIEKIDSMI